METETSPLRPDLSSLPWETEKKVCVLLAEIGGAVWRHGTVPGADASWYLMREASDKPGSFATVVAVWMRDGELCTSTGWWDDPLQDDGAAWRLMVRERISIEEYDGRPGDVIAYFREDDGSPPLSDAKRAVVLAVLRKYVNDPRWADLIRPLLEE